MNEATNRTESNSDPTDEVPVQPSPWKYIERPGGGPRLMTSSTLTGTRVLNRQDETLGTISDIMLNVEEGGIAYAVMASGGFMGIGERLFALPWYALALDTERKCCVLNADQSEFDEAHSFDKDHFPESP